MAHEIQAAARKFLDGGSAKDIWSLACSSDDNKKALVETTGVVSKLVDLLVRDEPHGEGSWAFYSLYHLVLMGQVAQDAIAQAHNGAIFKWLNGPQDYGNPYWKTHLITNLTSNHPTNTLLLNSTSNYPASSFTKLVLASLQNGDIATAALGMNELFAVVGNKENDMSTIPARIVSSLICVTNWDPSSKGKKISAIRDTALRLLAPFLAVKEVQQALVPSNLSVADHLKVLKSQTSGTRGRLLAVLGLRHLASKDGCSELKIASGDLIRALLDAAKNFDAREILADVLRVQSVAVMGELAQCSPSIRKDIVRERGAASLIVLSQSEEPSLKSSAMDTLCAFLGDKTSAKKLANVCGVPFMLQLLQYNKQHATMQQQIPSMEILTEVLVGDGVNSTHETKLRQIFDCGDAVASLVELFNDQSPPVADATAQLYEKLSGSVPLFLNRLRDGVHNQDGSLAKILPVLEGFSRVHANQNLFQQCRGVETLAELVKMTTETDAKVRVVRILANLACKNPKMSQLIVDQGITEPLMAMIKSQDMKIQTAALKALRNLANCDTNRTRIGSPGLMSRLIDAITNGKAMNQRMIAVGVIGNLAFLPASQELILCHAGDDALLGILGQTKTPEQVDTVATALWVLTTSDDFVHRLREKRSVATITKAIEPHQHHKMLWVKRLLERLHQRATQGCG